MIAALIASCVAGVSPATIHAIVRAESGGDVLALNANRSGRAVRLFPRDLDHAVALADAEIRAGHSVDMGLMQLNSRTAARLGIGVREAFDPCTNLRGASGVLHEAYQRAARELGPGQPALQRALSFYNTGDATRGFANGYVARFYADGQSRLPAYPLATVFAASPVVFVRSEPVP